MDLNVIIIIGYFGLMIACGVVAMRRSSTAEDYLVAGRSLPLWMFFPCLSAVILGGGSTFGSASQAYQHGLSGGWITIMFGAGILAIGLGLASRIAHLKVYTLSEMLERRYAHGTRFVSAVISTVYTTMISVVQIVALGTVLKALLGWDLNTAIVIGGVVTMIYTLLGGMVAISITDFIQFVLMAIGVVILLVMGFDAADGFTAVVAAAPEGFFSLTNIGGQKMLTYFLLFFLGIMIGQDIWQRMFTAKTDKTAAVGSIFAGVFSIGWGLAMGLCGILAYILVPGVTPQESLPMLVLEVLPIGLSGIVLAALMSALMSTVDSTVLAAATLITNDLISPAMDLDEEQETKVSRVVTALVGAVVIGLAVVVGNVFTALDLAYAYLSGCVFVPIMAAFFWKKATWQGALASMAVSGAVVTICVYIYGVSASEPILYGLVVSAIVMAVVSVAVGGPKQADLEAWHAAGGLMEDDLKAPNVAGE